MKSTSSVLAIVIVFGFCAFLSGALETADKPTSRPQLERYQISAFSTPRDGAGYYVIDTATGEVWMNYGSNKPAKVSEALAK